MKIVFMIKRSFWAAVQVLGVCVFFFLGGCFRPISIELVDTNVKIDDSGSEETGSPDSLGTETGNSDSGFDSDTSTPCADADADGYTDIACGGDDCDDGNTMVNPAATEVCNAIDDNCDGEVDTDAVDATLWYIDADGDGYGTYDVASNVESCEAPVGYVANDADCNDADARFHPGAIESDCTDASDYNCDGSTGYADADADGFAACNDCDDGNATVNPTATEVCNAIDDNCDGEVDTDAVDATLWYIDADGDGYGTYDFALNVESCEAPVGYVANDADCNDADTSYNPAAAESCTDIEDYNCDGSVSSEDADGDGFVACEDCDDSNAAVNPDATEECDSIDNDCDGGIDNDAVDADTWYTDLDGDEYGDASSVITSCTEPASSAAVSGDCDDGSRSIHPGATEVCGNTVDEDCDGETDDLDACALGYSDFGDGAVCTATPFARGDGGTVAVYDSGSAVECGVYAYSGGTTSSAPPSAITTSFSVTSGDTVTVVMTVGNVSTTNPTDAVAALCGEAPVSVALKASETGTELTLSATATSSSCTLEVWATDESIIVYDYYRI